MEDAASREAARETLRMELRLGDIPYLGAFTIARVFRWQDRPAEAEEAARTALARILEILEEGSPRLRHWTSASERIAGTLGALRKALGRPAAGR